MLRMREGCQQAADLGGGHGDEVAYVVAAMVIMPQACPGKLSAAAGAPIKLRRPEGRQARAWTLWRAGTRRRSGGPVVVQAGLVLGGLEAFLPAGSSCRSLLGVPKVHLNDYQRAALRTAAPKSKHNELFHLLLGLVGETGEIAEKAKKIVRDRDSDFSQWDAEDLKKELGDSLWYIAVIADYFGIPLDDVAQLNIAKLADRQRRGVIGGSGDGR
jgi:NTP pyrophosphatase (non-canonical NTP hydrolase)